MSHKYTEEDLAALPERERNKILGNRRRNEKYRKSDTYKEKITNNKDIINKKKLDYYYANREERIRKT